MRTFAQKPKAGQQTTSSKSTKPSRGFLGQSRDVQSILNLQRTIGNQAVLRMLQSKTRDTALVQLGVVDPVVLRGAAAEGVSGAGGPLPHLEKIQASFGRHDVTGVRAHLGVAATRASASIGAMAYTTGDDVAFVAPPNLRTAAHEAAHVIQQRNGVQLAGGFGQSGDRYEQQADAVADRVVAGQSSEHLLDRLAVFGTYAGGTQRAVQRVEIAFAEDDVWDIDIGMVEAGYHHQEGLTEGIICRPLREEHREIYSWHLEPIFGLPDRTLRRLPNTLPIAFVARGDEDQQQRVLDRVRAVLRAVERARGVEREESEASPTAESPPGGDSRRVQLRLQPEPHVVFRGVNIPIPTQVGPPDNSIRITQNAVINVRTIGNDRYSVLISIPSWSGDTRMVLGSAGMGTVGCVASRNLERRGFPFAQRALQEGLGVRLRLTAAAIRWAVSRPIAFIGGMIQSNQFASELEFSRELDDGTTVDYVVFYVPNSLRAGSQRR